MTKCSVLNWLGIMGACILFILFLSVLFMGNDGFSEQKHKKVLVLHSYHQGFEWTDSISQGIQSTFKEWPQDTDLYFDYLDTKRHPEKTYSEKIVELLALKGAKDKYDAILVVDNRALDFLKERSSTLYPGTPIVFCGINNYRKELTKGLDNITGIEEFVDHTATLKLMLSLNPDAKKILVIIDSSMTGQYMKKQFETSVQPFKGKVAIEYYENFNFDELSNKIGSLRPGDLIYLTVLNLDKANRFISYTEGIESISSASRVPIYGAYEFYMGKGIVGGMLTSGFEQGKEAALMIHKILDGEKPKDIPIKMKTATRYMFDYLVLKKFGIPEAKLPRNCVVINQPQGLMQIREGIMMGLVLIFLITTICIVMKNRKHRKQATILEHINDTLNSNVSEKDQELNEVIERISIMMDTMSSPVYFKDTHGVCKGCNKAFADMILGLPEKDAIGLSIQVMEGRVPNDLAKIYQAKDQELINNPGVQNYESQVQCADGIRRDFIVKKACTRDAHGVVTGIVGVLVDITMRRKVEQEREALIAELNISNEKLEKLSITDALTGLSNRGYITWRMEEEFKKAERHRTNFSIIMFDLDHFKHINDSCGHHAGDLVLQSVARVLKENTRNIDVVGRYGGEEFLILLPNTGIENGYEIAERIRKNIESMTCAVKMGITISGGIVEYHGESATELFNKADELLYKAKEGGRNRIEKMN